MSTTEGCGYAVARVTVASPTAGGVVVLVAVTVTVPGIDGEVNSPFASIAPPLELHVTCCGSPAGVTVAVNGVTLHVRRLGLAGATATVAIAATPAAPPPPATPAEPPAPDAPAEPPLDVGPHATTEPIANKLAIGTRTEDLIGWTPFRSSTRGERLCLTAAAE
jgi:hypothetical protein